MLQCLFLRDRNFLTVSISWETVTFGQCLRRYACSQAGVRLDLGACRGHWECHCAVSLPSGNARSRCFDGLEALRGDEHVMLFQSSSTCSDIRYFCSISKKGSVSKTLLHGFCWGWGCLFHRSIMLRTMIDHGRDWPCSLLRWCATNSSTPFHPIDS